MLINRVNILTFIGVLFASTSLHAANIPAEVKQQIEKEQKAAAPIKPDVAKVKPAAKKIETQQKLYKLDYVGDTEKHLAAYEDTLIHLARKNNLGFVEIRSANPHLDPWIPGEGAEIILPKRHILPNAPKRGVVINLAEMRLFYFDKKGNAPLSFPIGIGREGLQTPVGTTTVTRKAIGPSWRPTERMRKEDPSLPEVIEAGPNNPLGTHALYLGWPQYAIHGTNRPYGIGRRVSSGCIRMYPEGILKAYDLVNVGTEVTVVDQPIKAGWADDMLYLEAHAGQELADEMERLGKVPEQEITGDQRSMIEFKAGDKAARIDWDIVLKALNARSGYPVPILKTEEDIKLAESMSEATDVDHEIVEEKAEEKETKSAEKTQEEIEREKAARVLNASYNE